jgi:hypothetical protein
MQQTQQRVNVRLHILRDAWDAISLHTTPGIAAHKPLEVELLYNGVGLDVLGIGYDTLPEDIRTQVVAGYPRPFQNS